MALAVITLVLGILTLVFRLTVPDALFGYLHFGNTRGSIVGLVETLLVIATVVCGIVAFALSNRLFKEGKRQEGYTLMIIASIGWALVLASVAVSIL